MNVVFLLRLGFSSILGFSFASVASSEGFGVVVAFLCAGVLVWVVCVTYGVCVHA